MAWSLGHWLILIVALAVGAVAGWALRDRRNAAAAGHTAPIVEGDRDPVAAVVTTPAPTATVDDVRPEATVDPAPTAVADHPVPGDALAEDRPAPTGDRPASADTPASDVDPADMVLTGDPVPAPRDEVPPAPPIDSAGRDTEMVLPVAAGVTGPVETTPATTDHTDEVPTPVAADATDSPTTTDALPTPVTAEATDSPATADTSTDEPLTPVTAEATDSPATADTSTDALPTPVAADATDEPATTPDTLPTPAAADDEPSVPAASVPAASVPAASVPAASVPAPRAEVATPPVRPTAGADGADDFRRIQGVGPKIAAALQAAGIRTYRQLAELDEAALREMVRSAGLRSAPGLASWPQQAKVLAGAPDAAAVLPGGTDA
ncbi:helix-hairpin-helix domain-containing protein [Micromonospora sp. BQ11]|uniref:helix-hairpin-helix domain-containing protein n=1 Tax=Micromonospora sp. BQ11 TaxID=3452212 RepID=UPI003F890993